MYHNTSVCPHREKAKRLTPTGVQVIIQNSLPLSVNYCAQKFTDPTVNNKLGNVPLFHNKEHIMPATRSNIKRGAKIHSHPNIQNYNRIDSVVLSTAKTTTATDNTKRKKTHTTARSQTQSYPPVSGHISLVKVDVADFTIPLRPKHIIG